MDYSKSLNCSILYLRNRKGHLQNHVIFKWCNSIWLPKDTNHSMANIRNAAYKTHASNLKIFASMIIEKTIGFLFSCEH